MSSVAKLARTLGAERCETHGSWVLLFDGRALKIKRPVRYSFMDYSTLERRLASCIAEVEVNDELAPGVYCGVRALLERDGDIVLGPMGPQSDAVEYAVEMRRYDERSTMAGLLADGRLEERHVDAVATRIATFHDGQPTCRTDGAAEAFELRLDADLCDLAELLPVGVVAPHRRFGAALLRRHADTLDDRARRGLHRDGHGDLRADHVLLEDGVLIVDRIEFDPELRCTDVADDLAFLLMDLEHRGARWAADALVGSYRVAGGDPADPSLRAGFAWRRALVRAKTTLLAGDQVKADELLSLADRLAWRGRAPKVVAVSGPPASGKSTLAGALAERLELPVVASDAVRKRLLGLGPTDRAPESGYAPEVTERVYAELANRAATEAAAHGGVVIDATFRTRTARQPTERALGGDVSWIWLDAPADVLRERAQARLRDPGRVSDADEQVTAELASSFEPLDEIPAHRVSRLDATHPPESLVAGAAALLDR